MWRGPRLHAGLSAGDTGRGVGLAFKQVRGFSPVRVMTATVPCPLPGRSRGFTGSSRRVGVAALAPACD
jgi:hypothetical protein